MTRSGTNGGKGTLTEGVDNAFEHLLPKIDNPNDQCGQAPLKIWSDAGEGNCGCKRGHKARKNTRCRLKISSNGKNLNGVGEGQFGIWRAGKF